MVSGYWHLRLLPGQVWQKSEAEVALCVFSPLPFLSSPSQVALKEGLSILALLALVE